MQNQAYVFFIFILNGVLIGLLFDVFRICRRSFKTPNSITYIQDILFWILTGLLLLFSIFKFNNGELRSYIFFGIIFGILIYLLIFSKIVINISVNIIWVIKRIFETIIIIPVKYILKLLRKILLKPISFVFINFRKVSPMIIMLINTIKKQKLQKDLEKAVNKKDFI